MAQKKNEDSEGVFRAEEMKKVEQIEKAPLEELKYEIVPTQGGGTASL